MTSCIGILLSMYWMWTIQMFNVNFIALRCAEMLLAYNADINYADGGKSPLYLACTNGHFELVKLLLDSGADRSTAANVSIP